MGAAPAGAEVRLDYAPRGAALEVFRRRESEVLLSGPAGTGKTRGALEYLHLCASKYAGMHGVILRKTLASLTASALVTYKEKVLHALDGVRFFGGSALEPPHFRYPNGSKLYVGGLDKASKVMSSEWDLAYVNEAIELAENDWESVTTRLRYGVMPRQQLLADTNPDAPTHWLKQRVDAGKTVLLDSRHEDNPALFNADGTMTALGTAYMAKLDALTGVRYLRLRKGIWAAAEGLVYEGWDRAVHLVDRFPATADNPHGDPPPAWTRYLAVDFGYTNPFVCQWWAEDPDGRLYRYRELYRTQRLVEDHAAQIKALSANEPRPVAILCDHDAEDRATLARHLGWGTMAAHKAVSPGIQAVASRLRPAGDGRPRLFLLRDSVVERDPDLVDAKKPGGTEEEFDSYVWDLRANRKRGEEPLKDHDHGLDALRYLVAHRDLVGRAAVIANPWGY